MFDVDLGGGESYSESANYQAGPTAMLADLPWGRLGLTICYDLRFPALHRALAKAGAKFIAAPAAFTRTTGEAHWHTLLRARAIETCAFILAAGQGGLHENGRETFGHSLVISPWGEILAEAGTDPQVVLAEIDAAYADQIRRKIPSLTHDRDFDVVVATPSKSPHLVHEP
jgi:predicted amidohydrolase